MNFLPTTIQGAWLIELEPRADERGSFARIYCRRELEVQGTQFEIVQANLASTRRAGTIRGLHYQVPPDEDQKLVRCIAGAVHDVLVDMRPRSPTYRAVFQARLDSAQRLSVFIPGGVAHGYQALDDGTDVLYLTDRFYVPGLEHGCRFDDPALGIRWPLPPGEVADRDRRWPLLG
jgi:dTDP-4-dehydrorhamnose 3,5-epimerase